MIFAFTCHFFLSLSLGLRTNLFQNYCSPSITYSVKKIKFDTYVRILASFGQQTGHDSGSPISHTYIEMYYLRTIFEPYFIPRESLICFGIIYIRIVIQLQSIHRAIIRRHSVMTFKVQIRAIVNVLMSD